MTTRREIALIFLVLAVGIFWLIPASPARADIGANVRLQEGTGYPAAQTPGDNSYPGITDQAGTALTPTSITPGPSPTGPTSTAISTRPILGTLTETSNPLTPSPTAVKNLFGTEDSEISGALVTPPTEETPQPSSTPLATPTVTESASAGEDFRVNRGLFVAGFFIPIGLVLLGWLGFRLVRSGEFSGK
jgi:hypothetical protein